MRPRALSRPMRNFYPRPPRGGRRSTRHESQRHRDFYPRPPRGGRPMAWADYRAGGGRHFYPRPPRGGRRFLLFFFGEFIEISIHALREEGDALWTISLLASGRFLSTPSARRATDAGWKKIRRTKISIHALREESDPWWMSTTTSLLRFLSTPSARRATRDATTIANGMQNFYPRPPRGGRLGGVRNLGA